MKLQDSSQADLEIYFTHETTRHHQTISNEFNTQSVLNDYLPVSKVSRDDTYTVCWEICLLAVCLLIGLLFLLAALCGGRGSAQHWLTNLKPSLICGTNIGIVKLQDELRSVTICTL